MEDDEAFCGVETCSISLFEFPEMRFRVSFLCGTSRCAGFAASPRSLFKFVIIALLELALFEVARLFYVVGCGRPANEDFPAFLAGAT